MSTSKSEGTGEGKSKILKVLQVSDCHVAANPAADYRSQNADRNLGSILSAAQDWHPDLVLATGDISEDASPESYARVATLLGTLGAPILALPGNHDDPAVMCRFFPEGPWDGPYLKKKGRWSLVLLNSTAPGKISGSFSQTGLLQLDKQLQRDDGDFALVALHHQPVPVNAHWIDRYGLEDPEPFLEVIDRNQKVRCIAWGHVHHDFQAKREDVVLLGAPSSVANSLPGTQRFSLDSAGPACRWLELGPNGIVETGLIRPA